MYELTETTKYFIRRKGKIFGFLYDVGEWLTDSQGNRFCCRDYFESLDQAKSFLNCWYKETYGDKNVEIIENIKL